MQLRGAAVTAVCVGLLALLPAVAHAAATDCLTADPPTPSAPPHAVRFGITPLLAGSAGDQQGGVAPEDESKSLAALHALRPKRRELVLRLNRMFFSDGTRGIHHYARIVDRYARAGFDTELQVRYHPTAAEEGDMKAWKAYVREAVRILGRRPSVRALSITNEPNFPVSPNTSDGSFGGVREAVVKGIVAADRELRQIGRRDIELGFSVAWRWLPPDDASFWETIGRLGDEAVPAGDRLRRAADLPRPRLPAGAAPRAQRRSRGRRGADAAAQLLHAEGGARRRRRSVDQRERLRDQPRPQREPRNGPT